MKALEGIVLKALEASDVQDSKEDLPSALYCLKAAFLRFGVQGFGFPRILNHNACIWGFGLGFGDMVSRF